MIEDRTIRSIMVNFRAMVPRYTRPNYMVAIDLFGFTQERAMLECAAADIYPQAYGIIAPAVDSRIRHAPTAAPTSDMTVNQVMTALRAHNVKLVQSALEVITRGVDWKECSKTVIAQWIVRTIFELAEEGKYGLPKGLTANRLVLEINAVCGSLSGHQFTPRTYANPPPGERARLVRESAAALASFSTHFINLKETS